MMLHGQNRKDAEMDEIHYKLKLDFQQEQERVLFEFHDFEMNESKNAMYYAPKDIYIDFLFDNSIKTIEQAINNGVKLKLK